MKTLSTLFLVLALTGCGTTPAQWQAAMNDANQISGPGRDYINNPIKSEPFQNQPIEWGASPNTYSSQNGGTMQFMKNTPNGIQYQTCQGLDSGYVYCY